MFQKRSWHVLFSSSSLLQLTEVQFEDGAAFTRVNGQLTEIETQRDRKYNYDCDNYNGRWWIQLF